MSLICVFEGSDNSVQMDEEGCQSGECVELKCSPGWEEMNGKCYFWSQEKLFWGAAEEKCRSFGGHLASVTSQDIHDYIQQNVRTNNQLVIFYDSCCRKRILILFGWEQQIRRKRVFGSGLTATIGTSSSGEAESPITKGMKMLMVRTVPSLPATKPMITKIGWILHANGGRGTLFAQDQNVQVQVLNSLV